LHAVRRYAESHWPAACRDVRFIKSAFRDFQDLLLIVDLEETRLPTFQELADLVAIHWRIWADRVPRTFLFLRLGALAFPLTPLMPRDLHRGVLSPATAPDVFLQLGETAVYWTDYAKWYLCDWRSNQQWEDAGPQKQSQLSLIARSAEARRVVYPLTVPALGRATKTQSMPIREGSKAGVLGS
jgi:hypothetical protein